MDHTLPPALAGHPAAPDLEAYLAGRMTEEHGSTIEAHLLGCDACAKFVNDIPVESLLKLAQARGRDARLEPTVSQDDDPNFETVLSADWDGSHERVVPAELVGHPRYDVAEYLGGGGMGRVFRATHKLMGRPVALKVIRARLTARAGLVDRFRREVRAAAQLDHPNIVRAYDADQAGDVHFLVMECVDGTGIDDLVRSGEPLPVAQACEIVSDAALGLQHAHDRDVVHRDVKPSNLILTESGTTKILDFGLARLGESPLENAPIEEAGDSSPAATRAGLILGTPDYMSPEQGTDARTADSRTDIYSLGCTLFHLLTGKPPFPGGKLADKLRRHADAEPSPPSRLNPAVPPDLDAVVARMMAKKPGERYASAAAVAAALRPFARPEEVAVRRKQARRRRRAVAGAAAFLLLTVIAAVVYRVKTDNGEIVVESDDPDVEVVVSKGGKIVRVVDTKSKQELRLASGEYDLAVRGGRGDLKLSIDKADLRRGTQIVARIYRVDPAKAGAAELVAVTPAAFRTPTTQEMMRLPAPADALKRDTMPNESWPYLWSLRGVNTAVGIPTPPVPNKGTVAAATALVRVLGLPREAPAFNMLGSARPAFSADDKSIAVVGSAVTVFDRATGRQVQKISRTSPSLPSEAAFSPDGRWLVVGCVLGKIELYDLKAGKLHATSDAAIKGQIWAVCFSPDGTEILLSQFLTPEIIRLSARTLAATFPPKDVGSPCSGLAVHPAGKMYAVGTVAGVRIFDAATNVRLHDIPGIRAASHLNLSFSPDGQFLAAGSDRETQVWHVSDTGGVPRLFWKVGLPGAGLLGFTPDGRNLWISRTDQHDDPSNPYATFRKLSLGEKKIGQEFRCTMTSRWITPRLSPDGRHISSTFGSINRKPDLPTQIWDTVAGRLLNGPKRDKHADWVKALAFSADGKCLASGAEDGQVKLWDVATGELTRTLPARNGWVHGLAFSPDGRALACSAGDSHVEVWDAAGEASWRVKLPSFGEEVACSPDGKYLAAGDAGGSVSVIDVARRKLVGSFTKHVGHVWSVAFDRTGTKLASAGEDGVVCVWDVRTMTEERRVAAGHVSTDGRVVSTFRVRGLPDNSGFATTGADGSVRVWAWTTGEKLAEYAAGDFPARGMSVRPDGKMIAVNGANGTVTLLDLHRPTAGLTALAVPAPKHDICNEFSPDGRHLAVGGHDGTIRLFRLAEREK